MINLEQLTAEYAQKIAEVTGKSCKDNKIVKAKQAQNIISKALGVLQEGGIYALLVYVLSKSGNGTNPKSMSEDELCSVYLLNGLFALLGDQRLGSANDLKLPGEDLTIETINKRKIDILRHGSSKLTADIKTALLVRQLFEQTLIYALFEAKALDETQNIKATDEASLSSSV